MPRRASDRDVAEIVRVVNLAYRVEDFFIDGDRTDAADIADRLARPGAEILVIDSADGRGLVAAVHVETRGDLLWFGLLSVDPAEQGRGHARALIEAVEQRCRDLGLCLIEIDVVNLREELPAFYARFGFAEGGRRSFHDSHKLTRPAEMVVMRKVLEARGSPAPSGLAALRQRLDRIDAQLLALIAERQAIGGEIAEVKQVTGRSTRDYAREREVLLGARTRATEAGISPELAEEVVRLLIRSSLTRQEQSTVAARGAGTGRRALVIGGAGKMGRWFVDFLLSQGFAVEVSDPGGAPPGSRDIGDFRTAELSHDFIVVAAPLGIADTVLRDLAQCTLTGVVFDIGSLKSPLRQSLRALRTAGVRVTSLHPMFGPNTELLSGRHVIFVDLGDATALEEARALFASTMAEQIVMDPDEHDRLIAYVLGLSHAVNIAFFSALACSGEAAPRLARLSSTTFDAQLEVASRVAEESPELYFEIQRLNDHGRESLDALERAVSELRRVVDSGDQAAFEALMLRGRDYLTGRRAVAGDERIPDHHVQ